MELNDNDFCCMELYDKHFWCMEVNPGGFIDSEHETLTFDNQLSYDCMRD